jgi:hypothetical protein
MQLSGGAIKLIEHLLDECGKDVAVKVREEQAPSHSLHSTREAKGLMSASRSRPDPSVSKCKITL